MTTIEPAPAATPAAPLCQNCATPLLGEHCYRCGQPVRGLVRHFSSIVGDFLDSVFEIDGRIVQTLGPLLFRPGYLSNEYFAGRRVRYVSPVRLFVFLSLLAFFAAQFGFDLDTERPPSGAEASGADLGARFDTGNLVSAATEAELVARRDEALAEIAKAKAETAKVPGLAQVLASAEREVLAAADRRQQQLRSADPNAPPPARDSAQTAPRIQFGGQPWDARTNPIAIAWLPDGANARLNAWAARGERNIARIQEDPNQLKDAVLSALPSTLFLLLPLFALLLKLTHVFKRRLYMEHLIVALHSHAFLCASLFLLVVFGQLADSAWRWLAVPAGWLEVATAGWMPLYLLLMQKRVYGQGWLVTLWNYAWLGFWYLILLSLGITATLLVSLVAM
ncbi:MAG: DUF3667 domain-containing protein [Xanthomonadaceae bacterium]|nr:DUF3667 domain-containing protein [Xanthomonadaceae bacterium]